MPDLSTPQSTTDSPSDAMLPTAKVLVVPYGRIAEKRGASYAQQLFHQGVTAHFSADILTETLATVADLLETENADRDVGAAVLLGVNAIYGASPDQIREKRMHYLKVIRENRFTESQAIVRAAEAIPKPTEEEMRAYINTQLSTRDFVLLCYVVKHGLNTMQRAEPSQEGTIYHFRRLGDYAKGGLESLLPPTKP